MIGVRSLSILLADMTARMGDCIDEHSAACIAVIRAEQALPGWAAAVALVQRRRPVPLAANSALERTEWLQAELREGPSIDAATTHRVVQCADTATTETWPSWAPAVHRAGYRSVVCLPLGEERMTGVLTLAHPRADELGAEILTAAELIATYTSIGLDTVKRLTNMTVSGDSKAVIGQATGILMERFTLTEDQAFAVLRRHSQDQQRKLRDVADELLATGKLPEADGQQRAGWTG